MSKGLRTGLIVLGVIFVLLFLMYSSFRSTYNSMVSMDESVKAAWAQVENQYQRRYDLIPNLVETVKGFANQEQETLTAVTEARSRAGGVMQMDESLLEDPEAFARFQEAQAGLGSALQRLLMITENYPDLKSNQNFLALQDQLEGTENRIAVERQRFNETARSYNTYIRQFPRVIIANMMGFREKAYFSATEGASSAPQVSF
ncbi:LemA family protein [Marispirochaeta aestuarii]|uniref:LemA family protein n=1 Tax=Marispirochaeta aestuarii TaxID=1963862 RepID=A0A1Y1RWJ8_9SPIO|nr:LemA family protein [Marispirochaeta aestuarii]ORC33871.1 LemA family protein [Marispirochaeta aestuarii]